MKIKGFTLIELLAVIVILTIIALIAIPIILNIVDRSRESSIERSKELYLRAVELAISRKNLSNEFNPSICNVVEKGNLMCDIGDLIVEVKGQVPTSGTIKFKNGKIVLESLLFGGEYVYKDLTNAEIPEIVDGLVPVIYEESKWKVVNIKSKWYNYGSQEWANAVILKDGIEKNIGDIIDINSEVQGMFVWIPRYEYKIEGMYGVHSDGTKGTKELPGEVKVNFIPKETTTSSDGYILHPAFKFGDTELKGVWIGKFETTGTSDNPTVLPSLASLKGISVGTQFQTAQILNKYLDKSLDSHIIKNSEWGAVTYLSQSKYGKYGSNNYTGIEKQVRINNCSNFITGIGADNQDDGESSITCTTNTYETEKGQSASTTGNITGIYDMSGGTYEYVMGYLTVASTTWGAADSGDYAKFTNTPNAKYFDDYKSTNIQTACNGSECLGQALNETAKWYGDANGFVELSRPWIMRGGSYTSKTVAGIFNADRSSGYGHSNSTFRITISKS